MGYPALILNPDDSTIDAQVFESDDLRGHWSRLDEFERPGYQRVVTTVYTPEGDLTASITTRPRQVGRSRSAHLP